MAKSTLHAPEPYMTPSKTIGVVSTLPFVPMLTDQDRPRRLTVAVSIWVS
jgi:hypothetical protein